MEKKSSVPLKENPRERANIISVLTFWWTIDLFKLGYQKVLVLPDLFQPLRADRSDSLGDRLEANWLKQVNGPGRPSLIRALIKTFWKEYAWLGFLQAFNDIFVRISQPLLLGGLLKYFRQEPDISYELAVYYGVGLILLNAISPLTINQYILTSFQNGMKVRIAVCSTVYRKALRLSRTALGETSPGKVVNLLSNDVNRFDIVSVFLHSMWSAPLLTIIVGYLLWREAGIGGLLGMGVIFIVTPIQAFTGKLSSKYRLQTALRTDERIRLMDEIISGVQVIKMYAWEVPFAKLIQLARKTELKVVRKNSYVRALFMTFMLFTTRMALFCTMLAIVVISDDDLTASTVFVTAAYYGIVAATMSQMFVRGVAEIAEARVSLRRLRMFLMYDEKAPESIEEPQQNGHKPNGGAPNPELPPRIALSAKNVYARWDAVRAPRPLKSKKKLPPTPPSEQSDDYTLENVNVDFRRGKLIGVVGPVGSGKTSLLQAILRELPLKSGKIHFDGKLSYSAQEPWVFAGSVKQNILFGEEFDKERYDSTVRVCALIRDFEQLPYGDRTIIGERGASLSGGQKARITLARAVYRKADIYLLDDPLSAVDAHVGRHLFEECIGAKGKLGRHKATRILITHQVHFLKDADYVIIMRDGKVDQQGSPQELSQSGIDIAKLLESEDYQDTASETTGRRSRSSSVSSIKSIIHASQEKLDEKEDTQKEEPKENVEESSKGKVKGSLFGNYLKSGSHPCILIFVLTLFLLTQAAASVIDWWVSYWTAQEELRSYQKEQNRNSTLLEEVVLATKSTVSAHILSAYEDGQEPLATDWCAIIHGSLLATLFLLALARSISFYQSAVRSSQKLHDAMFKGVVSAPMRFFDVNPSGRILNRFSKDMGAIDEFLPKAVLDASQIILNMFGAIIVTSIVNPIFLIPLVILAVVFSYMRKVYLKTSKNIKRLEGITRSPVFTHFAATLNGLSTIRAFNAQGVLIEEFDAQQDTHTSAWYMFITTSSAFGFALDVMCVIFFTCIVLYFLLFPGNFLGDKVGLAITQTMSLTGMVQWGIRQSAEVANQLMAVERVAEYRDLESEIEPAVPHNVGKSWPNDGKIRFNKVDYRYYDGGDRVLKNLEFEINSGEKVGIVGRTGAGKSSIVGVLFRIALIDGEVIIDGIDTSQITLQQLRSKISIIPQDPVLFSGTLRRNLDPFEEYPDSDLWGALEQVELRDVASGPLGLQSLVAAGGSNFSVGQRQLVCLARAILRDNKILVMDEATANVDPHTDELIQHTIRSRFAHCTVLTVAHRLHTIMDSDKVLVMDAGEAVEFGPPHEILQLPAGIFKNMVNATGQLESENLQRIAKEQYEKKI